MLAVRLPTSPPTVKMTVTKEKTKSDMGMHVVYESLPVGSGRLLSSHVKTALIWFSADI